MAINFSELEKTYGLPPGLLNAVAMAESSGVPDAINHKTATGQPSLGMFQFQPATAKQYGIDPMDPEQAALGAAKMLSDLKGQFRGDLPHMLAAYNWGSGNLTKYGMQKAPEETRNYINKIQGMLSEGGQQVAQAGNIASDVMPDAASVVIEEGDDSLVLQQKQAIALARARAAAEAAKKSSFMETVSGIGTSPAGQSVGYAIDSATDLMGNAISSMTGNPYKDKVETPDLNSLREKGWGGITLPEKFGAVEESAFGTPTMKMLGLLGATPPGMLIGAGLSKANELLEEHAGIPHQYSVAAESLLPFVAKRKGVGVKEVFGEEPFGPPMPPPGGPGGGGGSPRGILPAATDMAMSLTKEGTSGLKSRISELAEDYARSEYARPEEKVAPVMPEGLKVGPQGKPLELPPRAYNDAQDILRQILQEEGIKPEDVAAALEEGIKTGKPLTALDVATKEVGGVLVNGKQLMAIAKSAANKPGAGASLAGEVAARGLKASERVSEDFSKSISSAPYYKVAEDAIQGMEGSGPFYQSAYKQNRSMESPVIDRILETEAGNKALKYAAKRMNNKMQLMGELDPELLEQAKLSDSYVPGSGGISKGLNLQTLQFIKESFDEQIGQAYRAGEKGEAADLTAQKSQMVKAIDELDITAKRDKEGNIIEPGDYRKARATYATNARIKEALEQGRDFMTLDPEEIAKFMEDPDISNPEKAAFASGVRRALQDRIDAVNDGTNPINKVWKENIRKRVRPLFPDENSFKSFEQAMAQEQAMHRINMNFHAGSPTFPNIEYGGMINAPKRVLNALTNPKGAAVDALFNSLSKKMQKRAENMSKETSAALVRYLTTNDPNVWKDLATQKGK